jgi:hypothetical protein
MTAKWGFCTILVLCLTLCVVGCRTTRPDVKPPKSVERLVEPPPGALASGDYPRAAHDKMVDTARQAMDAKTGVIIPTRGGMGPGQGMAGPGGGR